jgi:hypothetical protein
MGKHKQSAAAYKWPDRIVISPVHKTKGPSIIGAPWFKLAGDVLAEEIGLTVLDALNNAKSDLPLPDFRGEEYKMLNKERYKAAGVKSEREYMQFSKYVSISRDESSIYLNPTRNNGTHGDQRGYVDLPDKIVIKNSSSATEIGEALIEAWDKCR